MRTGRVTPSADAIVRLAEILDVTTDTDYLLTQTSPRRPLHAPEIILGDRVTAITELPTTSSPSCTASSTDSSPRTARHGLGAQRGHAADPARSSPHAAVAGERYADVALATPHLSLDLPSLSAVGGGVKPLLQRRKFFSHPCPNESRWIEDAHQADLLVSTRPGSGSAVLMQ